jgi:FKBP-type peptidyl-prolyl cis-trans isomerase FklB
MNYGMAVKALSIAVLGLGLLYTKGYANTYNQGSSSTQNGGQMQMATPDGQTKTAGEAFLEKNKNKPGVITLPDGLQYKILIEGQGERPTDSDSVTVHYSGTLIDGTVFDSSYKRGEPAVFPVNGVIPGWSEALKLMKVGSTWKLYIPASLAYGEQGAPPVIGPNQTLIFKVRLIAVNKESST